MPLSPRAAPCGALAQHSNEHKLAGWVGQTVKVTTVPAAGLVPAASVSSAGLLHSLAILPPLTHLRILEIGHGCTRHTMCLAREILDQPQAPGAPAHT